MEDEIVELRIDNEQMQSELHEELDDNEDEIEGASVIEDYIYNPDRDSDSMWF